MALSTLSALGFPSEVLAKLARLNIKSVEAFSSRLSDAAAIERLRDYLDVDSELMDRAVRIAAEVKGPTLSMGRARGGALVR